MLDTAVFAGHFARAVELFRDPDAKDAQKAEFRALVGLVRAQAATVRVENHRLLVNGTQVTSPGIETLAARFSLHGVAEVTIPAGAPVQHVFELLKALADQPGVGDHVSDRLRATGAFQIGVEVSSPTLDVMPPAASEGLGTGGLLRGDPMSELGSVPVSGASDVTQVPVSEAPEDVGLPATGRARVGPGAYDRDAVDELPAPAAPPPPKPRASASPLGPDEPLIARENASPMFAAAVARSREMEQLLADLAKDPQGPSAGDTLAILERQVEGESRAGHWERVLAIMARVVEIEQVLDGTARRPFAIALKRMTTRPLLREMAKLAVTPAHQAAGLAVLRRAGDDGADVLIDLLISSELIGGRRAAFNAVKALGKGTDRLLALFNHKEWYVVRQAAELAGEMQLEEAVPWLGGALNHGDERVRKAIALALAKIGTGVAVEPLRRALRDPSPGVRLQVALGIGGRQSSALAMLVVVAMDEEKDPQVERELTLALGRIGSPDAVQALIKLSQSSGVLFNRKPTAKRLAAVEGLRIAGTPAAVGTLQGLANDSDRQVKAAAQAALQEIKPRR